MFPSFNFPIRIFSSRKMELRKIVRKQEVNLRKIKTQSRLKQETQEQMIFGGCGGRGSAFPAPVLSLASVNDQFFTGLQGNEKNRNNVMSFS